MNKQSPISFILVSLVKIAVVAAVIYFVYQASVTVFEFGYRIFNEPPLSNSQVVIEVEITEEQSVLDIGELLVDNRLVDNQYIFFFQEWFSKYHDDMVPGIYALKPSMTGEEMVEIMARGGEVEEQQ